MKIASSPTPLPRPARSTLPVLEVAGHSAVFESAEEEQLPGNLEQVLKATGKVYYDPVQDAADREAYYSQVKATVLGGDARQAFLELSHLLWSSHKPLKYSPKQEVYPWYDLRPSLRLRSIYSPQPVATDQPVRGRNEAQLVDLGRLLSSAPADAVELAGRIALAETRKFLNCEHVVPKIWLDDDAIAEGDLHHLFTAHREVNAERSSNRLGEVGRQGPSILGEGWSDSEAGVFEPAAGKGAVARATLYILLRYPGKVGDRPGEYQAQDLQTLLRWHREDPVSPHELHRNQEAFARQGNRNPLIDHPKWAEAIDFTQGLGR